MQNTPTPNTKLVALAWDVHIVKGYREVIEVPADITDKELTKLLNLRYQDVDESLYTEDRDNRELGNCSTDGLIADGERPTLVVKREGNSLQCELPAEPQPEATAEAVQPEAADRNLLAINFAKLMVRALTAEELQQVIARNRTDAYGDSSCATHDFLDANEVMLQALALTTGVPDAELDLDTNNEAMNYAWQMAKACDFDANRVLLLAAQSQLNASFGQSGDNQTGALAQQLSKLSGVAIGPQEELIAVSGSDASQPDAGATPDPYEELSCGNYHVVVEIPATGPMQDLVAGLQRAYDEGADGQFKVLVTHNPGWMVVFERKIDPDEMQYLRKHAGPADTDVDGMVMAQLADELSSAEGLVAAQVVEVLRNGDAHILDFAGVLESAANCLQQILQKR